MTIALIATNPRFRLGHIVATPGALEKFTPEEIAEAIRRHSQGDWGDMSEPDAYENELALKERFRVLSIYTFRETKLWVITEADRSSTCALLPSEY